MSEHMCDCGRPSKDATICVACGYKLDAALAEITDYRGLAWDLDIAVSRSTEPKMTATEIAEEKRAPGVLAPMPLPYNPHASEVAAQLKTVLVGWALVIVEETGADHPKDSIAGLAAWIRPRAGWLRHHPAGQEALHGICDAVDAARRVCDRRPERLYAGVCACGTHLYARVGRPVITCRECGAEYAVEARRRDLLSALDDHLANSQQLARLVGYLGLSIPDSTIRWWAGKGRIAAHGNKEGCPLYRLGDVVRTYAQSHNKAS